MENENILDRIVRIRAHRLAARKIEVPDLDMERLARELPKPRFDLLAMLSKPKAQGLHVIAEVKKASPSKGVIRADFNPLKIARDYLSGGATGISVLTEVDHFQGADTYLQAIAREVALPCLRKDFLTEAYQIFEAKALGASAYLLIVASLNPSTLRELIQLGQEIGLTPLTEVHTAEEVHIALEAGAPLIGINNRDLKSFQISLDVTFALRPIIPASIPVISESGIFTPEHMRQLSQAKVQGALIGESLMREIDLVGKLKSLAEA
jgi:indole-3-glycerol phosphate synthase